MKKEKDPYFAEMVKEAFTDSDLSGGARVWSFLVGIVGTVVSDPITLVKNTFNISDDNPGPNPNDPTDPRNPGAY